jgi:hypothetical protein
MSALAADGRGSFWGTITYTGSKKLGSIFALNAAGFRRMFNFTGEKGKVPGSLEPYLERGTMILHTDGNLYGSTPRGGVLQDGRPGGAGQFFRIRFGPTPITLPADLNKGDGRPELRGSVHPNGKPTTAYFEYGTDPQLQNSVRTDSIPVGGRDTGLVVYPVLSGLEPGGIYYFRVVAQNSDNVQPQRGAVLSFVVPMK